jgi:hypothetical protein
MEPEKLTSSEIIENIEVNVRNPSLKAGRIHRKDFRAFLLFAAFVVLVLVIGAVAAVKYMAPTMGNIAYAVSGSALTAGGTKLFRKFGFGK